MTTNLLGWRPATEAHRLIREAHTRFLQRYPKSE